MDSGGGECFSPLSAQISDNNLSGQSNSGQRRLITAINYINVKGNLFVQPVLEHDLQVCENNR